MCYHYKLEKTVQQIEESFEVNSPAELDEIPTLFNGFQHLDAPIITHDWISQVQFFQWGLLPFWAKDFKIQNHTLNARVETLKEKPSFRQIVHQRCLVIADGFFEWQWLDAKGKQKQKYLLQLPERKIFCFAGLWSKWQAKESNQIIFSFTIITGAANELMAEIHNTKKRMPLLMEPQAGKNWLNGEEMMLANGDLEALKINF
ncbi:MAG: SOS response-associated peptidase [Saprospiraceae bacterium]|jgi:putative SOS response-associated peptidase YedK